MPPEGWKASPTGWGGTTSFTYDADSNLEAIAFPAASGNVDEYAYDRANRMSGASFDDGAEALASISYSRNKIGQVEEEAVQGLPGPKETPYAYDKDDRLTNAGEASFEYDPADNLIKGLGSINTYDAASQLEAGTGISYTYDKLGERTKATPKAAPATTYKYDQAGSLVAIERPEEGEVAAINESFAYDGTGLIASRTTGATTEHLTWDPEHLFPCSSAMGSAATSTGRTTSRSSRSPPKKRPPTYIPISSAPRDSSPMAAGKSPAPSATGRTEVSSERVARRRRQWDLQASTPIPQVACNTFVLGSTTPRPANSSPVIL